MKHIYILPTLYVFLNYCSEIVNSFPGTFSCHKSTLGFTDHRLRVTSHIGKTSRRGKGIMRCRGIEVVELLVHAVSVNVICGEYSMRF